MPRNPPKKANLVGNVQTAARYKVKDTVTFDQPMPVTRTQRRLDESVKRAVVEQGINGIPHEVIAAYFGITVSRVRLILGKFRREARAAHPAESKPNFTKRVSRLAEKAIIGGLLCRADQYKRAAIGIRVKQGIGEFRSDNGGVSVQVNTLVQSTPAQWRDRYVGKGASNNGNNNGGEEVS